MSAITRIKSFFDERRIILAITLAIVAALVMTAVSLRLYQMDYVSHLDVSLPEREDLRKKALEDTESVKFDATGPLNAQAFSDFQTLYTKNQTALGVLGKLDGDALSDESLRVGSNE